MKKKYMWYAIAFLIPVVVSIVIYIGMGVYPFGDSCILQVDMYHQYCPFFTEFMNKLQNGGSLMYTWNLGLGSNFVALFAYYLASPLNWLLFFCPEGFVIEFMTILTLLKTGFAGWSFFYFLKERYQLLGKDRKFHQNTLFPALVFATTYAFSGFMAAYSWNIMWLDSIALAPLIILGLEKLVKEKKVALYYITLSIAILSNYYISIMICIFLVLYFIIILFEQKKARIMTCCRFAGYSLLAGGTSAVLLLPELIALGSSGSTEEGFPEKIEWYFSVLEELVRGATTAETYIGREHWPNLYAGAFSILLFGLYILNRRISWKEKIPRVCLIVFFLISFANNYLDFIWHGMHFPQSLPGRQSFLYIFVLLVIGFETVRKWKGIKIWHVILSCVVAIALLVMSAAVTDLEVTDVVSVVVTCIFITCYALIMIMLKLSKKKTYVFLRQFALLLAFGEVILNVSVTGFGTTNRKEYLEKANDYEKLLELTKNEDSFYRVEDPQRKTKNDDALYGYPSTTIFSSLMNIDVSAFYRNVYMEGGANYYCYNGATPIVSAMLSVKYILTDSVLEGDPLHTFVAQEGSYFLYENNYCLPFGFMMTEDSINAWEISNVSRIGNINSLAKALGASGNLLISSSRQTVVKPGETTITMSQDGYYYALYDTCSTDQLHASFLSGRTKTFSKTTHRYLLDLGYYKVGDVITISNANDEEIDYNLYRLNMAALDEAYQTLSKQTMELVSINDTKIEGKIEVQTPGRLILPIPSEPGWMLYVNGEEMEITDFCNALISTHLDKGTHSIRLEYETPGLKIGAVISASCVGCFVLLQVIRRKLRCGKNLSVPKC